MVKKTVLISIISGCICFCLICSLKAQRLNEYDDNTGKIFEKLSGLENRLEKVSVQMNSNNQQILLQLKDIKSAQEKIIRELEIVKVRATRR